VWPDVLADSPSNPVIGARNMLRDGSRTFGRMARYSSGQLCGLSQGIHRVMDFKGLMGYLSKHRRICVTKKFREHLISKLIITEKFPR